MMAFVELLTRLDLTDRPHARAGLLRQVEATGASHRIVEAIASVPRHAFVPAELAAMAYAPSGLWLPNGAILPAPDVTARILCALDPQPGECVLELGTACGYLTVLLAQLAGDVVTLDTCDRTESVLELAGMSNIRRGGAIDGVAFDATLVAAPQPVFSPELLAGARRGVLVIGPPLGAQRLVLARTPGRGATTELFDLGPVLLPASTLAYAPVSIPPPPGTFMSLEGA